jgi:anti-anti-sigma factor
MSARGLTGFYVQVDGSGTLLLRGELEMATIQDLQVKIDEVLVPGQPVILDLAQLSFLDSSAIHCFNTTRYVSGHPVVLLNATSTARRILNLGMRQPEAWVFDGEGPSLTKA